MHLWVLYSLPLIYVSVFVSIPCCLDDYSFVIELEVRHCDAASFALLFKIALAIQGLLWFHTNFKIVCSSSVKNSTVLAQKQTHRGAWVAQSLSICLQLKT